MLLRCQRFCNRVYTSEIYVLINTRGLPQILGSLFLVYTVRLLKVLKQYLDKILEIKADINIQPSAKLFVDFEYP